MNKNKPDILTGKTISAAEFSTENLADFSKYQLEQLAQQSQTLLNLLEKVIDELE